MKQIEADSNIKVFPHVTPIPRISYGRNIDWVSPKVRENKGAELGSFYAWMLGYDKSQMQIENELLGLGLEDVKKKKKKKHRNRKKKNKRVQVQGEDENLGERKEQKKI